MIDHGRLCLLVTVLPPDWNETATSYERESTIHSVFEERVRETPEAVALDVGRRTPTYRERDDQARGVALRLRPFLAPGFFDAVVTLLAVLKAGAA
jgi:polyketide synthase PksN